ncbi:MAG: hypothetical protein ACK54L_22785, partial [Betaproteobacteria bacterium]
MRSLREAVGSAGRSTGAIRVAGAVAGVRDGLITTLPLTTGGDAKAGRGADGAAGAGLAAPPPDGEVLA